MYIHPNCIWWIYVAEWFFDYEYGSIYTIDIYVFYSKCCHIYFRVHNWKIFETAKAALKTGGSRQSLPGSRSSRAPSASQSMMNLGHSPPGASSLDMSHNDSGGDSASISTRSSMYFADMEENEPPSDLAGFNSLYR